MKRTARSLLTLGLPLLATAALSLAAARAQTGPPATLTTLVGFTGSGDGAAPLAGVVQGRDGNFYGTTSSGGLDNNGTVFKVAPAGVKTTLYNFRKDYVGGAKPGTPLVQGNDGNFYGTTEVGGASGSVGPGTVFRITPDEGNLTTLVNFQLMGDNPTSGANPRAGLILGRDGNFYGTTRLSGRNADGTGGDSGTVFQVTPAGVLTTLRAFNFSDGSDPRGNLVQGDDGNFYGTTFNGGVIDATHDGVGVVYKITPAGVITVLHVFTNNGDGSQPTAGLSKGPDGTFYGTAGNVVFQITPAGAFTTLYTFKGGSDGLRASSGVIQGGDGNLYGTTPTGGSKDKGTVFQLSPAGTKTILYSFTGGSDGASPNAIIQGSDGNFYGTTFLGDGSATFGTVFRLAVSSTTPGHPAFFAGEAALGNGVYFLRFAGGNPFGYYSYLTDPHYVYHQDLGYEYVFEANDGRNGVFLYDFKSGGFFYTSPSFPFPYLYDFSLNAVLYYFPDPNNEGRYNTDGVRYFSNPSTGQIISK